MIFDIKSNKKFEISHAKEKKSPKHTNVIQFEVLLRRFIVRKFSCAIYQPNQTHKRNTKNSRDNQKAWFLWLERYLKEAVFGIERKIMEIVNKDGFCGF